MSRESIVRGVFRLPFLLGASFWFALALASFSSHIHIGIIEVLFLLGPWMVVPLGADLIRGAATSPSSRGACDWALFTGASLTTASFFLENRVVATWFASSWLLVCAAFAGDGLRRFVTSGTKSFAQFCFAMGEGYLLVAGIWLVASRAGISLFGFHEPIVLLTAVHFHFAGFASAVLAGLVYQASVGRSGQQMLRWALTIVVLEPGVLGLAFFAGPKAKLVGALVFALGLIGLACALIRVGIAARNGVGRWLLFASGGSVAVGMILVAVWAAGEYPLQAFVNIRQMAEFHGVLNGVGFVGCGLVGWGLLKAEQDSLS
jgi:YndJ-like protein